MFGAMGRADVADMGGNDPHDIAATFDLARGLEHTGFLFLLAIRRPPIIGPAFDIEPGMGQGAERRREIIEALLQQFTGQGMNHLPLQPDLERSGPVMLAVPGIDRHHGMNKFMHEDA